MQKFPLVSIVIPVYNVEAFLIKCLDSCFAQTYSNIEVIAVDDGSSDSSGDILDEYARKEPRLKVIHQQNSGVVAVRNEGVAQSNGDWIMFVDSDDYITEDAVNIAYQSAINSNADIALTSIELLWKDGSRRHISQPAGIYNRVQYTSMLMMGQIIWGPCSKLFCRKLFFEEEINVPHRFKIGEDLMMNLIIAKRVENIVVSDVSTYFYRKRSGSTVYNVKYGIDYWTDYMNVIENIYNSQNFEIKNLNYFLTSLRLNISFNILAGGIKINDKQWINSILSKLTNRRNFTKKERITLLLLKYPLLQSAFYFVYKKVNLRKL